MIETSCELLALDIVLQRKTTSTSTGMPEIHELVYILTIQNSDMSGLEIPTPSHYVIREKHSTVTI